jgi:hypothetical protein
MKPEIIAILLAGVVASYRIGLWLLDWYGQPPTTPDPWEPSVAKELEDPDCMPVCHRCLAPQEHLDWFCPNCGASVGTYSNFLPFVYIFSEGEVFRNGVNQHIRWSALTIAGYFLISLSSYLVFAPLYWYFLFKNIHRTWDSDKAGDTIASS